MYGKTHSDETKAYLRDINIGRKNPKSEKARKKLSISRKGKPRPPRLDGLPDHQTQEARDKISASTLGKPKKKGYKQSDEQKQKKLESFQATLAAKKASSLL